MMADIPHIEYDNKDYITKEEADAAVKAAEERNKRGLNLHGLKVDKNATLNFGKREIPKADINGGTKYKAPKLDII